MPEDQVEARAIPEDEAEPEAGDGVEVSCQVAVAGKLDELGVQRLDASLRGLVGAGARFVTVDLTGVQTCCPELGDILADTQRQLTARRGMLSLVGVEPGLLTEFDPGSGSVPSVRTSHGV